MNTRPLVLASSKLGREVPAQIAAGLRPRLDFLAVAEALGADVLDDSAGERQSSWKRKIEKALASDLLQAEVAWRRRGVYSAWLSTSEKVGLPLALREPGKSQRPHVLIAHNLTSPRKRLMHRLTGVLHRFEAVIALSRVQEDYLRHEACLPDQKIRRIFHSVDTNFFRPLGSKIKQGDYMLAVGREYRDYEILVQAAACLGFPLTIVGSSLWSRRGMSLEAENLPSNVTLRNDFVSYTELRDLYEGARLVVVPLHPCDYAAGVTGVLEARAMGKAVIATRTQGLDDYLEEAEDDPTVPPGDPQALAMAIRRLWQDDHMRRALGNRGRARVEQEMSLDTYAERVAAIVRETMGGVTIQ